MTCLGFSVWRRYRAQWGPLLPFEGTVHGAQGKPLQIAGKTQHLDLQWGEAHGRACFIVIVGLESPPCLIGMDIMRPLRVRIDVTNGTATPAQPDPQTVHLNAAQQQQQRMKMSLPGIIPPAIPTVETAQPAAPPAAPLAAIPAPPRYWLPRHLLPLTPLAVLCCCKPQIFHQKRPASFVAKTHGTPRMLYSVPKMLCRRL